MKRHLAAESGADVHCLQLVDQEVAEFKRSLCQLLSTLMPPCVALEQMRIFDFHHRRTRAAGHDDRLTALENANRVLCLLARQRGITAIEHRLAAARLRLRKV